MSQQWMSIIEYSRSFNVSDMTVRRRIKNGRLKASLKDGKYFIPVDANHQPESDDEYLGQSRENLNAQNHSGRMNASLDFQNKPQSVSTNSTATGNIMGGLTTSPGSQAQATQNRKVSDHPKSGHDGIPRGMPRPANLDAFHKQASLNERSFALPARPQPKKITSPSSQFDTYFGEQSNEDQTLQISSSDFLDFANKAIDQAEAKCRLLRSECELKLAAIETELSIRDKKIESLNQQIEDLQLLIKVIENKV